MSYLPTAYVEIDGAWTIDRSAMERIWALAASEGKVKTVFYDGSITTAEEFIEYMQRDSNFPTIIWNMENFMPAMVGWFNSLKDDNCQAHFICFNGSNPVLAGKALLDWWASWGSIKNVLGIIPETNEKAIKYIGMLGFEIMGTVPDFCRLFYEDRRVGGTFGYYNLNGGHHG